MGLRGKLRRLERSAKSEAVILRLRDGGLRVFSDLEVFSEMFLCRTDLFWVRDALRRSWMPCARPLRRAAPPSRTSTGA